MAISVGSVEVDVVPNTRGIYNQLRSAIVPAATRAGEDGGQAAGRAFGPAMRREVGTVGLSIGQQIGSQIAARIVAEVRGALRDGITQGGRGARPAATRQGDETGGAFARSLRARLQAAFRSMPRLDVRLSDTGVDADLARLRARLETLSNKTIGVDVDAAAARAEAADIEERLRRIGAAHPNVAVRADTAAAIAQLAAMREEIDRLERDPARVRVEVDGSFGQRLRAAVQQAQASLPEVNITADTTPAQIEVMRLRAQLGQLADQRVGIDIDASAAMARIEAIQARLQVLAASDADVDVRVDTGAALAQLATVQAMVNRLDGQTARVNVDTRGAVRALLQLSIAVAGVAAIPAVPVLAAGLGSITAAALAAGAGVGALAAAAVPAFMDIREALEAQKQAQDAAANATAKGGQAAAQAAQRALQLESAQQALAAAERNAAQQITQAQQQVVQARQNAADVAAQAAQRSQRAARAVRDAEQSLVDAQRTARQAQQDLTQARRDAAQQLEDLSSRLANAQLSERDAALGVEEARARLAATQAAGSKATLLDQQRAQLAYDQAVQRLKDQQTETKRLQGEQAAASRAGVDGSKVVRQAQERLASAQQQVADRAQAVRDAQAEAARTQIETARQVAQAQQRVSEATANVAVAQQAAAESVASAQRQIRSAQLSAAGAADQAAVAQAKYQQKLAELSPASRATFSAFEDLKAAFKDWSAALQPHIMPIFTRALIGMRRALPGLTPFVREAAGAIGELQDRASRAFKSEGWAEFKKDLSGSVRPAIVGLGVSLANIGKGVGGILQAFMPHMDTISGRMQEITGRFADWGTSLKGSPGFERFLSYSSEMGPKLAETLGDIGSAFMEVSRALSPLSGPVLTVLGAMATAIASIATTLPWLVQGIYLAIIATRLWAIGMAIFNAVMNANPISLIIIGIIALVAAVIYAYKRFGWFRDFVNAVWEGIKTAALWAWNTVLKPVFNWIGKIVMWLWNSIIKPYIGFIVAYWKMVASVAMWLWRSVLAPVFRGIGAVISWWWTNIVKRYFGMVRFAVQTIAAVFRWLYNKAVKPVFGFIGSVISWWWTNIVKRYFNFVKAAISAVGDAFKWLYDKGVKPVMGWIGDRISWVWENVIKRAFDALKRAVRSVRSAFETAKDGIGKAWDGIKGATKKPINWVIRVVWNDGIVGTWKKIGDWIPGLPKLDKLPLLAAGGPMPVQPGVFNRPTAIVGEGNPRHPEYVIPTDPKYRKRALALHQAAGSQLLAEGGIIGKVRGALGSAADFLASPVKSLGRLLAPLLDKLKQVTGSPWGRMAAGLPRLAVDGLKRLVKDKVGDFLGGSSGPVPGGAGVRRWTGVVRQALALVGQPLAHTGITLRRMNQESGGNPRAVNLWDINAKNGTPSVGLMQVIGPTFRAHAGRFRGRGPHLYGVSIDPLANIYASMRYALSRYGSLPRAYNRPGGYDSGGYLMPGQLGYNGLSQPEAVLTPRQWNAVSTLAARGAGADGPGVFEGRLYLDSGEFLGTVRGEMARRDAQLESVLRAGRR